MRSSVPFVLSVAAAAALSCPSRAGIIRPGDPVAGVSQNELSARWVQWAFSFPDGENPVQDPTGALAHLGDQGAYFFLAGTFGGDPSPAVRTAAVRADQALFFPLMNVASFIGLFGDTEPAIRQDAIENLGVVSDLTLTLDGNPLPLPSPTTSLLDYYQETAPGTFPVTFPENAVFGVPADTYQAVGVGYWIGLAPLAAGSYQLHFTSRAVGIGAYEGEVFTQDMTYNLTVTAVPEPSSLAILATGLLGALGYARRRGAANRASR